MSAERNGDPWAELFAPFERAEHPFVAMQFAEASIRNIEIEIEIVLNEMDELRKRYEKRQRKGRDLLRSLQACTRIFVLAAKWAAKDANARGEDGRAKSAEERAAHVWRASVASFGDPAWRAAMGFPDDASFGVFGNDD